MVFLVIGSIAAATALAAWLVRRFSTQATGSGIPQVEAVLAGELPPAPLILLPVKFFGGLLAIGAGLMLLGVLAAADRLQSWPVEMRAAIVGVAMDS